jgi:hypothetical protein
MREEESKPETVNSQTGFRDRKIGKLALSGAVGAFWATGTYIGSNAVSELFSGSL